MIRDQWWLEAQVNSQAASDVKPGSRVGAALAGTEGAAASRWRRPLAYGSCIVLALLAAGLPLLLTPYGQSFLLLLFFYAALALSWNLIAGYAGYFSFGHVGFFGLGGYTAALLIHFGAMPWIPASLCGGIAAALSAFVIGVPSLRTRGATFAIITLAFSQALRVAAYVAEPFTGGGHGLSLPPIQSLLPVYFAFLAVAIAALAFTLWLEHSDFGLRVKAIRDDETAAEAIGIDTVALKTRIFMVSAFFPGLCGGIYVWYLSYAHPDEMFSLKINMMMIVMTLFGGAGTALGPLLGAGSLFSISEVLWARYPFVHQLLFGALIILLVLLLPNGMVGAINSWLGRRRRKAGR